MSNNYRSRTTTPKIRGHMGIVPPGRTLLVGLGLLFSILFITCVSLAFVGGRRDLLIFRDPLDSLPEGGIVLIAENVDVDIDEPAATISWTVVACGDSFALSGTYGVLGSKYCGVPAMPLTVYSDHQTEPALLYDPSQISRGPHERRSYQNYIQFDDEKVLDVQEARFYPFDRYSLSTSLHVVNSATNITIPIQRLFTLNMASNFAISGTDFETETTSVDGTPVYGRDMEFLISRPSEARGYAMILFGFSWMLAHATLAHLVLAWMDTKVVNTTFLHLFSVFATLVIIPQLRNSMPDAPDLDGFMIDIIGFFPQMVFAGFSAISLLTIICKRGILDQLDAEDYIESASPTSNNQKTLKY